MRTHKRRVSYTDLKPWGPKRRVYLMLAYKLELFLVGAAPRRLAHVGPT